MTHYIKAGHGFTVGLDFSRVRENTPIELAPKEVAWPNHVIGYIAGNPQSSLSFMRSPRVRVHVRCDCLTEY